MEKQDWSKEKYPNVETNKKYEFGIFQLFPLGAGTNNSENQFLNIAIDIRETSLIDKRGSNLIISIFQKIRQFLFVSG